MVARVTRELSARVTVQARRKPARKRNRASVCLDTQLVPPFAVSFDLSGSNSRWGRSYGMAFARRAMRKRQGAQGVWTGCVMCSASPGE